MNEYFKEFLTEFSPQIDPVRFLPIQLEKQKNDLPLALLDFWAEVGSSGYADGIVWSTNPEAFDPVLEQWLGGTDLWARDKYSVIARSAFDNLYVWGKKSGVSIVIHPLTSAVTTKERDMKEGTENAEISAFFLAKDRKDFDFLDMKNKPLFSRAIKKLGPLHADEMYGFEPALCIGGLPKIENLVKVKMLEHLVLLSQLSETEFTHLDLSRHS